MCRTENTFLSNQKYTLYPFYLGISRFCLGKINLPQSSCKFISNKMVSYDIKIIGLYSYFLLFVFQVMATFHQNMPWDSVVSCLLAIWSCIHPAFFKRRMFLSTRNTHKMRWKISHPIWLIPKAFDLKGHRKTSVVQCISHGLFSVCLWFNFQSLYCCATF